MSLETYTEEAATAALEAGRPDLLEKLIDGLIEIARHPAKDETDDVDGER